MSPVVHKIYIYTMTAIVIFATVFLGIKGYSYYSTDVLDRFYHPDHQNFKPGGIYGHGLGIIGTFLIFIGVVIYIIRKRARSLAKLGRLKHWLEFHIFLCSLGPVLVLYHTAFKFGGVVSIAFWSMIAVVLSGVIGRFIYIQIPRTIQGRELSLDEIERMKVNIKSVLQEKYSLDENTSHQIMNIAKNEEQKEALLQGMIKKYFQDRITLKTLRKELKQKGLPKKDIREISKIVSKEIILNNKINRLQTMQKLFKYWHVAHLPFALIMLVIVVFHVGVTLYLGYTWIF